LAVPVGSSCYQRAHAKLDIISCGFFDGAVQFSLNYTARPMRLKPGEVGSSSARLHCELVNPPEKPYPPNLLAARPIRHRPGEVWTGLCQ